MSAVIHSMESAATAQAKALREGFARARARGLRAKDAAESLGCSEGEALAAHVGDRGALQVTALAGPWLALLQGLQACGPVMALTRNESVVHEKTGVYQQLSATGPVGLALGEDIDLRLFFHHWHAGFAVTEPATRAELAPTQSLQFFNAHGRAVHKVFARSGTDRAAFEALVARFAALKTAPVFVPEPAAAPAGPDAAIDADALRAAWSRMQDTHEFFALLKTFGAERQQAFRCVEGTYAHRLGRHAVAALLHEAALEALPIMVFVGSGGCIQIHTGPVRRVEPLQTPSAQWINVLDEGFNLHLRADHVFQVWAVRKPTADGVVTSVEVFDTAGALMAMFFGARKPGQPERPAWRDLVARLPGAGEVDHAV